MMFYLESGKFKWALFLIWASWCFAVCRMLSDALLWGSAFLIIEANGARGCVAWSSTRSWWGLWSSRLWDQNSRVGRVFCCKIKPRLCSLMLCPAPHTHSLWRAQQPREEILSSFHWWDSGAENDMMYIFCFSCKMSLNICALFFIFHIPSGLNSSIHSIDVILLGVQHRYSCR